MPGVQHHDGLAEYQAVLRSSERQKVDTGVRGEFAELHPQVGRRVGSLAPSMWRVIPRPWTWSAIARTSAARVRGAEFVVCVIDTARAGPGARRPSPMLRGR